MLDPEAFELKDVRRHHRPFDAGATIGGLLHDLGTGSCVYKLDLVDQLTLLSSYSGLSIPIKSLQRTSPKAEDAALWKERR